MLLYNLNFYCFIYIFIASAYLFFIHVTVFCHVRFYQSGLSFFFRNFCPYLLHNQILNNSCQLSRFKCNEDCMVQTDPVLHCVFAK